MRPHDARRTRCALATLVVALGLVAGAATPAGASHGSAWYRYVDTASMAIHPSSAGSATASQATLWANGSATSTVDLAERAFRLEFEATGTWCEGPAELEVRVDGVHLMSRPVVQHGRYAVVGDWAPGRHHVSFRFVDDHHTATCDRNLAIGALVVFRGVRDAVTAEVPSSHRVVTTRQETDLRHAAVAPITSGRVSLTWWGDSVASLWGRGTLTAPLDAQGNDLHIRSFSYTCGAEEAAVEVRVDGRTVYQGALAGDTLLRRTFVRGPQLLHTVEIELLNPYRDERCTRTVRIERLAFSGAV